VFFDRQLKKALSSTEASFMLLSLSASPSKPNIIQKVPIVSLCRGERCRRIALGY